MSSPVALVRHKGAKSFRVCEAVLYSQLCCVFLCSKMVFPPVFAFYIKSLRSFRGTNSAFLPFQGDKFGVQGDKFGKLFTGIQGDKFGGFSPLKGDMDNF